VVRKIFSADFFDFHIFDRNFAKIVAPPSDENENNVLHLKSNYLLKKAENRVEIGQKTATNARCSGLGA